MQRKKEIAGEIYPFHLVHPTKEKFILIIKCKLIGIIYIYIYIIYIYTHIHTHYVWYYTEWIILIEPSKHKIIFVWPWIVIWKSCKSHLQFFKLKGNSHTWLLNDYQRSNQIGTILCPPLNHTIFIWNIFSYLPYLSRYLPGLIKMTHPV